MSEYNSNSDSEEVEDPIIAEIRGALTAYLRALFIRRDTQSTLSMFSPNIMGFGVDVDEIGSDQDEFSSIIARDISESPNPVYYDIDHLLIRSPMLGLGLVSCELRIRTLLRNEKLEYYHLRLSLVMVKSDEDWLVEQMHVSFPTTGIGDNQLEKIKELEEHRALLQKMIDEQAQQIIEAQQEISELITTDDLTGLFNHAAMEVTLDSEILRSLRYNHNLSIVLLSIDRFSYIIEHFGKEAGDQLLASFAELIEGRVRKTDVVGRWSDAEFMMVCINTGLAGAMIIAEHLRSIIASHTFDDSIHITASFGVCAFEVIDTRHTFLSRVSDALQEAKRNGRNRVEACL